MELNRYQKVALTTVGATIFLIFVGGLVRASGAGLGCPDWPKCFGMWIPPTSVSELPPAFDASQFNVLKTWTEYINRLVGVVIGLLIMVTFGLSFRYRNTEPAVFYSSAAAFVLVLIQGWLGGQVVITGLNEWLITLHMLLAMLIMMTLIFAVFKASERQLGTKLSPSIRRWLLGSGMLLLVITFVQLSMGTQVREAVDVLKNMASPPARELWLSQVGSIDEVHRSFSWAVFILGGILLYLVRRQASHPLLARMGNWIFGIIILQIATGVGLYYLGMPPVYQVVHLVGVAILIALEFMLLLIVAHADEKPVEG
ncbi:COX15/CtaA family protein [Fodinibius sediminis]|uniref:Cytochrome c oxidase assembly protein subunit 15 n=1 Tax=Fodinibius sediminis TaxID=1214077 RepID=A0A521C898_9BACT|nr:COX15/CtaA family protein [Fodinibius sediminis]SMO55636.1 cytochrome c oxidase assembly protein subunit 15 [Fodinibius sediminis]